MRIFNINSRIYIQITEEGWKHLEETVGTEYINACIKSREVIINKETWYKLQCWECFHLMPNYNGKKPLFNTNIMFDDKDIKP